MKHAWIARVSVLLATAFLANACGSDTSALSAVDGSTDGHIMKPPPAVADAPPVDPEIFAQPGAQSFITANERELLSAGTSSADNWSYSGRAALAPAAESEGGVADSNGKGQVLVPEAPPDVTREIVEADVYKLEGDLLYVLNRYRGLVIIDVSNPDDLRIRGRLPFQAMPVEMYVREGRAYVVSSDYFVYWQYDREADPHGFHGSQVMIADVSDPDAPRQLGTLPLDGEVTDTRMVGDVLYTVSRRRPEYWRYNSADWEDRTWIVSLNVANPADIREIDRITFSGSSTLIHVAHHAIFVAAWDPNYYLTNSAMEQETLVTYVDISNASGRLAKRGHVYIPGQIADKFKMNWHDGHLRVFSQRWREDDTISLHVVSTATPDRLKVDATIALDGVSRSGLQATRFASTRAFALSSKYSSSSRTTERQLHGVDLSQPLAPRVAGRISVDMDASHFEVHDNRLLALGTHRSVNAEGRTERRSAVALFDIENLRAMRLLDLATLGEGYSSSEANRDYKAFKTFPDLGLILVPLDYWKYSRRFSGVQLVDWIDDSLSERGRVDNAGGVRRAFPVGQRIVAVGELSIVAIDARDRNAPKVTSELQLVHNVRELFDISGLQVQLVQDPYSGAVRLEVHEFGPTDNGPALAQLDLPFTSLPEVLHDGDILHLIGRVSGLGQVVHNADLTDPRQPKLRGQFVLSREFDSVFRSGWGWYWTYWSPAAGLALRNQIVPATFRHVVEDEQGRRDWHSELRFLDLRDPDNPRMADGRIPADDYPFVNKVTHGNILYSTHVEQATTEQGESLVYHVRAFVDRVDVTDPDAPKRLPSVNIPGYLVDVSDDGKLWYTIDYQWDDYGRRRNSLNVLRLVDDNTAELISVLPVADQIHRTALRPGRLATQERPTGWSNRTIWLTAHKYPWWGVRGDSVASRQPYTVLRRVDFDAEGRIAGELKATIQGYHFDLLDVVGTELYLASSRPAGLLVLDVEDASNPEIVSTARTLSYLSRIESFESYIYAPLGYYGVHRYQTR